MTNINEELLAELESRYKRPRAAILEILREAAPPAAYDGPPQPEPSPQTKASGGGPRAMPIPDATGDVQNPQPHVTQDPALQPESPDAMASARLARDERMRLMEEYQKTYFLEDLPPIDPEDPWNQGIYMRFRINQLRYAQGGEPVDAGGGGGARASTPTPAAPPGGPGSPPPVPVPA